MRLVDLYRNSLNEIVYASEEQNLEECVLDIHRDQLAIFQILDQEQTIVLWHVGKNGETSDRFTATFGINEASEGVTSVSGRLQQLDLWSGQHPDFLGNTDDGKTVLISRGLGFAYYGNGLITLRGQIIDLPAQQAFLFGRFMKDYRDFVTATNVLEHAEHGSEELDAAQRTAAASKIISPLNKSLNELIGYSPIRSVAKRGWILEFEEAKAT